MYEAPKLVVEDRGQKIMLGGEFSLCAAHECFADCLSKAELERKHLRKLDAGVLYYSTNG